MKGENHVDFDNMFDFALQFTRDLMSGKLHYYNSETDEKIRLVPGENLVSILNGKFVHIKLKRKSNERMATEPTPVNRNTISLGD